MAQDRLLIIDDDPAIGAFIAKVAKSCSYDLAATTKADVFKERARNWLPTHIVLDLQMPQADGVELLRFLAQEKCDAKILLVSGFEPKVLESAFRLGVASGLSMAGTLPKPLRADDLRSTLTRLRSEPDAIDQAALARAMERGELLLAYQPKVSLETLQPVGYEALIRWRHPVRGMVPPSEFIPLAEASGLIDQLTETVIDLALRQLCQWGEGFEGTLSINVSGRNLNDLAFVDRLGDRCANLAILPERVALELTESHAMADPLRAMDILTRLRLKGFHLSIDDFGTGYSSLLQLARMPFSELKVDQSFVRESQWSAEARAIIRATIDLAHNLGLRAVAEGVETAAAMRLLAEFGCDIAQGYYIAKPLLPDELVTWGAGWDTQRQAIRTELEAEGHRQRPAPRRPRRREDAGGAPDELAQTLAGLINPLWEFGRNALVGWQPTESGISVLMVPYQKIVDRFPEAQRLLHGRRLMGRGTFQKAMEISGVQPVHVPLRFRIADEEPGAVPMAAVEEVLKRYSITETRHRAVTLFDVVGFSKMPPKSQVAQLNSLECSINTAQRVLLEVGRPIDLARTTTGDGFYIWNRDKGAQADLDTYLLTMLVLADNAVCRREGRDDMVPLPRTCFSVGPHFSYHQVDGLDPHGHDYIVGDVTITLARIIAKCQAGQILIGDFSRPIETDGDPGDPVELAIQAQGAFDRFDDIQLNARTVRAVRCYLTGNQGADGGFVPTRYRIRDKHHFEHGAFNQKFNIYLTDSPGPSAQVDPIYLGLQQSEVALSMASPAECESA